MVLCEWDKANVCAQFPTTTQQGEAWDNSSRIGEWADESARVFLDRAAHIEFAMHGVGHEHWDDGVPTRAEWFGRTPDERWPWDVLQGHLECFRLILSQYGLDTAHGVSFPPSLVPCAFRFYWDDADPESTGALMKQAGVRFCSTPFSSCCFAGGPPDKADGGFDHGLIVLDRGSSGVRWDAYSTVPDALPNTSICGIHWPNVLTPDPMDNRESVSMWVSYLERIRNAEGLMLARNMAETCSQWLYHSYATLRCERDRLVLDATEIPSVAWENDLVGNPIVKIPVANDECVSAIRSNDCHAVACWETDGWAFIVLRLGDSRRCTFEVSFGPHMMPMVALGDGTHDVIDLSERGRVARLALRMYGRQTVSLRLPFRPAAADSTNPDLVIHGLQYDLHSRLAALDVSGRDIHGEQGEIVLRA